MFSEAKLDEFENSFNYVLSIIGEHFTVDRVYYFTISNNTATFMHEWTNTGIESQKGISYDLKLGFFPWWLNQLETKSYIKIRDVNKLDKEVQVLKKELISKDIKSTLAVPVYRNDEVKGFIGIALNNESREWDSNHITTLTILSNVISNALDKNKAELTVYEMAYLDYLTQLPNRAYLYEQLNLDLKASYFHGFVVGLLDLDDFKSVNDNYGHAAGDDLLQQVALRLNTTKGDNNLVCRFGGDEFLFLFRDIETQDEVKAYGELMIRNFQKAFIIASEEMMIKASFGLFKVEEILDVKTIIAKVDSAMYKAKELGKNQYFIQ